MGGCSFTVGQTTRTTFTLVLDREDSLQIVRACALQKSPSGLIKRALSPSQSQSVVLPHVRNEPRGALCLYVAPVLIEAELVQKRCREWGGTKLHLLPLRAQPVP